MRFNTTLTEGWPGFLRSVLVGFVACCAVLWKWKGLGLAFENHDTASIERMLIKALAISIGTAIGNRLLVKTTFRDPENGYQNGRGYYQGYRMGKSLAAKLRSTE